MNSKEIRERLLVGLLRWAPKGAYANLVGALARRRLPPAWRERVFTSFAQRTGANLDEAELPLGEYESLDAFFTRRLKPGARPIEGPDDVIVSPCDGKIQSAGVAEEGNMIQAKGQDYALEALLGEEAAPRFRGGAYVTVYLAPKDYHRVHFCAGGQVTGFHHIPGKVWPVNEAATNRVPGLFAKNERLVTYQRSPVGDIATVMVAAVGVGNISVTYDDVQTRRRGKGRKGGPVSLDAPVPVDKGDELGTFHLGSTVILVFEPGKVELLPLEEGAPIRLGTPIARRISATARQSAA